MSGFSIRLTHKIMAIGVVGMIGLLAFGAIYQAGSWSQNSSRVVAVEGRALSSLNQQISIKMLEARRAEKDFQLRRDESYAKRHAELSAGIDREFEKLKSMVRSSGLNSIPEKIDVVRRGFANYVKNFASLAQAEVKLGLNEKLGLSGSLRAAVHDIESKLKEIDDARLTNSMLMLRRHEKDFMLRRDVKYVEELKKTAAEFSKSLASANIDPAIKADIANCGDASEIFGHVLQAQARAGAALHCKPTCSNCRRRRTGEYSLNRRERSPLDESVRPEAKRQQQDCAEYREAPDIEPGCVLA